MKRKGKRALKTSQSFYKRAIIVTRALCAAIIIGAPLYRYTLLEPQSSPRVPAAEIDSYHACPASVRVSMPPAFAESRSKSAA